MFVDGPGPQAVRREVMVRAGHGDDMVMTNDSRVCVGDALLPVSTWSCYVGYLVTSCLIGSIHHLFWYPLLLDIFMITQKPLLHFRCLLATQLSLHKIFQMLWVTVHLCG